MQNNCKKMNILLNIIIYVISIIIIIIIIVVVITIRFVFINIIIIYNNIKIHSVYVHITNNDVLHIGVPVLTLDFFFEAASLFYITVFSKSS